MRTLLFVMMGLLTTVLQAEEEPIALFNGNDLKGWQAVSDPAGVAIEKFWSVEEGVLRCTGNPAGYIRTDREFADYKLVVEWRWPARPGNNGVLVHTSRPGELGVWPKSLEVQLGSGDAGDFWAIGTEIEVDDEPRRVEGRRHRNLTDDSEHEPGEWNQIEIVCRGDTVVVHVNGVLVNEGRKCSVTKGAICLQSEGAPIEYRKVELTPLAEEPK